MSSNTDKKEAMKRLRQERKQWISKAAAAVSTQKEAQKTIREFLGKASATIPQIAEETGIPSHEVLWFIATMKKYGEVVESGPDGSYYRYAAVTTRAVPEKESTGEHP